MNVFGIVAFRSRQQVMHFEGVFNREGVPVRVVSTPREVSAGCGLSLQFSIGQAAEVQAVLRRHRPSNLIGVYQVTMNGGKTLLSALSK